MPIKIYNSFTRKKEIFKPVDEGKVKMYVCGPTVYDDCHIGHARSIIIFDVIFRFFKASGFDVKYVRNFTDVDDKIINRARELNMSCDELANKYIESFYSDMDALNVQRASYEPRATQYIDKIIDIIKILIEKEHAYEIDGDVFFAVESFDDYGDLSGRSIEDMEAGARVQIDKRKNNPFDFALWKSGKPDEPTWDSPWGKGRPGWHIECSAMSMSFLGQTFDIHGGGKDLIFPHHENEIAQSECCWGKKYVNYWIHNGFVNIDKEKMSKSLGNFIIIKDILKKYHPETIRLFLLSNHYRSPIDYSKIAMDETVSGLNKLYKMKERLIAYLDKSKIDNADIKPEGDLWQKFNQAMEDDFNTAKGIGFLFDTSKSINRILDSDKIKNEDKNFLSQMYNDISRISSILGILLEEPVKYFEINNNLTINNSQINVETIEKMINERTIARKSKKWDIADKIRNELADMGVIIEDSPKGTTWKINQ